MRAFGPLLPESSCDTRVQSNPPTRLFSRHSVGLVGRHLRSGAHPHPHPCWGRTRLRRVEAFLFNFSNCLSFLLLCVRACACVCPLKLCVRSIRRGKKGFLSSAIRNGIHWRAHTTAVPARNVLLRGATWNFLYSAGPVTRDTCAHTHTHTHTHTLR